MKDFKIQSYRIYQNYEYKSDDYAFENIGNLHEILSIFDNIDSNTTIKKTYLE